MLDNILYDDIELSDEQVGIVRDYIRQVGFHLPGATPEDFAIERTAYYLGYLFQQEDLEAFGVGLTCTVPGREHERTFIRISRGRLLGDATAPDLPVNDPVLAAESMTLHDIYAAEQAPLRRGVGTYDADEGLPGADMDLTLLEQQLTDILAFHNGQPVRGDQEILDLKVFWGTLLAGRYLRLTALRDKLSPAQAERLSRFESETRSVADILEGLELPTLDTLETTPVVDG